MPRGFRPGWKNLPAWGPHTIGTNHDHAVPEPHIGSHIPATGSNEMAPPRFKYGRKPNRSDDEKAPPSRYCNPPGFHGLYGMEPGKNYWQKDSGIREVKRGATLHDDDYAVKGKPLR